MGIIEAFPAINGAAFDAGIRLKRLMDLQLQIMIRVGLVPGLLISTGGWLVRAEPQRLRIYALFWMIAVAFVCLIWMSAGMVRIARSDPVGLHEDSRQAVIGKKVFWIHEVKEWQLPYILAMMFCLGCGMVGVYFWGTWGNPKTPRYVDTFGLIGTIVFTALNWNTLMIADVFLPTYFVKFVNSFQQSPQLDFLVKQKAISMGFLRG